MALPVQTVVRLLLCLQAYTSPNIFPVEYSEGSVRNHLLFISAALFATGFLGCGGGSGTGTSGGSGTPANPVPSISSILPTSVAVGSSAITLYVYGSNFNSGTVVLWNGASLSSTYVNSGTVTAAVPQSNLSNAANVQITVSNTGANTGASAPTSFLVANPRPILNTISPQFVTVGDSLTITATGSYFISGTQIEWNGNALNTTQVNATTLAAQVPSSNLTAAATVSVTLFNPGPGGGPSATIIPLTVYSGSTRVAGIPLYAKDIVWDGTHGLIYASIPGASASATGNVVAINPAISAVTAQVAAGSNPNQLSVSSDGTQLWVGEDGTSSVERFALPALTSDLQFNLPKLGAYTIQTAKSLQAEPGSADTVAVLLTEPAYSGNESTGTAVFDRGTPRPAQISNNTNIVSIAWDSNASTLYGSEWGCEASNVTKCSTLNVMEVNSTGVSINNSYPGTFPYEGLVSGTGITFDSSMGYIYANDGQVLNPTTGDLVGAFDLSAFYGDVYCAVDAAQGLVFFVGETIEQSKGDFGYTIEVFDNSSYRLLHSLLIPNFAVGEGPPTQLLRWGNSGLAFLTSARIYLVDGKFVNSTATPDISTGQGANTIPHPISISPESAVAGSNDVTVKITGTDFIPGAQAYWSYYPVTPQCAPVQTTYVSSTELHAIIPACDFVKAGTATITVSNGTTSTVNSTPFQFTIFPVGSNPIVMDLAATSLAWDKNSGLLYAVIGSSDPQYPNSIVAINPATGRLMKNQQVGPNPSLVRVTSDGAYLYVGYQNSSSLTRLQLPGLNAPLTWPLGADALSGPITANDIEPAPGAPQTVAVAGSNGEATVFDNSVVRPNALVPSSSGNTLSSLQWGPDASVLYGSGTQVNTQPWDFTIMNVDASGLSLKENDPGALQNLSTVGSFGNDIHYDAGTQLLYVDDGAVVDSTNAAFKGGYNSWGLVVPDSSLNTVFVLGLTFISPGYPSQSWTNGFGLSSYNQKTFGFISSLKLPPIPYSGGAGRPVSFVRCGGSCLAFSTNSSTYPKFANPGMLYILNDPGFVKVAP